MSRAHASSVDRIRIRARLGAVFAALVLAGATATARGDAVWLQPERPTATPGAVLMLWLTTADSFGEPQRPVPMAQVAGCGGRLGEQPLIVSAVPPSATATRYSVILPRPGVAACWVELTPQVRTIDRAEVERYFREVYAGDELRDAWAAMPATRPWREQRTLRLRSYVRVGQPAPNEQAWTDNSRHGIDLAPETDPTALREGAAFALRVTRDGRPLAGALVAFVAQEGVREHVVVADADGGVRARLDREGIWMIRTTQIERATATSYDWNSESVVVTVWVPALGR